MTYDVESIRKRLKQSMGGKFTDPDQFHPDSAKSATDPIKYRFFVLPPLMEGDELKTGVVKKSMDQFFVQHANHWVNNRPTPCPRAWDNSDCPICSAGFDLLRDEKNDEKRRFIVKTWMPTTYYMVNIFFPKWEGNPEELRGCVKFYNAPKTCFDQWTAALLRDDKGDDQEPQAHGVFFDENAAFLFQLEVLKQGKQNSYKTSKFVTPDGNPIPMIGKRGEPNTAQIEKLLKARHNLWEKIEVPDMEKVQRVYRTMLDGDDDDDRNGGFDDDETADKPVSESKKESKPTTKSEPKAKSEPKPEQKKATKKPEPDSELEDDGLADDEIPDKKPVSESEDFDAPFGDDDDDDNKSVNSSEIDALLNQLEDDD